MSFPPKILALAAPAAALALGACTTGFPTQVSRYQALPAPPGQTFFVQAQKAENRGGLEFAQYANLVRSHLIAQGFAEAATPQQATLLVEFDYGVDNGQPRIVSTPGYGGFGSPFYPNFYYGRRSPFYYGWHDPFWGAGYGGDVRSYPVYTSYVDLDIRRTADGQAVFEGLAKARSRTDRLQVLVPSLVQAMFTGFPGNNGETVRITVPDPRQSASR